MPAHENPYEAPDHNLQPPRSDNEPPAPERAAYNTVTDLVVGPNIRWSDNLLQAVMILVSILIGAAIGAVAVAEERLFGALGGGLAGIVVGLLGSGIFLMIYRALRHIRGKHD